MSGLPMAHGLPGGLGGAGLLALAFCSVFAGLCVLAMFALGALTRSTRPQERMRRRLSVYTVTARPTGPPAPARGRPGSLAGRRMAHSTIEFTEKVLARRGLNDAVDVRLEAAGLALRTTEWALIHLGVAVGTALFLLLLSGGALPATVLGLLIGLIGPWAFLIICCGRREARFLSQLPDALHLLAGSLQAGYSLPQALDAVIREGDPPISTEFNRTLIETRLGLPVEDALERVADRMSSRDFSWVVMAIRVQREVGGNLAELLTTVSDTLRERERLRRQVRVLSSEGRLSGWVLGLLPIVFTAYLVLVRPNYISMLWTTRPGWLMLATATVLLSIGVFWISRAIKVEV
jgi:tight adherence protein B